MRTIWPYFILGIAMILGFMQISAADNQLPRPPAAPKRPVTDEYQGVKVTEDYRYLENISDPAVQQWSDAENQYARNYLDNLPSRTPIIDRLKELHAGISSDYFGLQYKNGMLFALKSQPPKEQPFLITLKSADDTASARVILDPTVIDSKGTTAIDFYAASLDGKYVAVCLSRGGSEKGTVHIYKVADGTELGDTIPRVNNPTAGGSVAWNSDGSGFYYTRYPHVGERDVKDMDFYQQVYFHKLGTPFSADEYAIGKEFPRIAEIALQSSPDGHYILATVANGDGGEFAHYILSPSGKWTQITQFADKISLAVLGPDTAIYMLSRLDAPRGKIIRLSLTDPELSKATTVVDTSGVAIQQFEPTASKLYVADLIGGVAQIRVFNHDGIKTGMVPVMPIASVWHLLHTDGDEILFNSETYVIPVAWYRYDPKMKEPLRTALFAKSPADFRDIQIRREFVKSQDGTKIPMTILMRRGTKLDSLNSTLLTAYGGYGISLTPSFNFTTRLWFDQGGIYAVANIRGGGEYGDDWHLNGNLTKKQNDYDDFYACAKNLIDRGYTSAAHLAIEGGSNGGLLMGVELTQHPELYRAVVSHSGIYDMLRVELAPNGEFNTTEYGSVKDPEQFKALYGYSPYHHVVDGKAYPAALFLSGANDGRVDPANSRKMVARLQAANGSKYPILLRTSSSSGHGIGSALSEIIAEQADVYSFLFDQLGVKYVPAK